MQILHDLPWKEIAEKPLFETKCGRFTTGNPLMLQKVKLQSSNREDFITRSSTNRNRLRNQ